MLRTLIIFNYQEKDPPKIIAFAFLVFSHLHNITSWRTFYNVKVNAKLNSNVNLILLMLLLWFLFQNYSDTSHFTLNFGLAHGNQEISKSSPLLSNRINWHIRQFHFKSSQYSVKNSFDSKKRNKDLDSLKFYTIIITMNFIK